MLASSPRVERVRAIFGLPAAAPGWRPPTGRIVREIISAAGPGELTAITGPSGAGKSTILAALCDRLGTRAAGCPPMAHLLSRQRAIIDLVGPTLDDALAILSAVGLADATLVGRTPAELSEGQRARLALALGLCCLGPGRWLLVDELGSGLDLPTAEAVAFSLARTVRSGLGRVVVATSRDELLDVMRPEVVVWQPLHDEAELVRLEA